MDQERFTRGSCERRHHDHRDRRRGDVFGRRGGNVFGRRRRGSFGSRQCGGIGSRHGGGGFGMSPLMTVALALLACGWAGTSIADELPRTQARDALPLVQEAAHAWAHDAHLAYLENDEALTESGAAARWGYLFFAPSRDAARAYSVEDGKIIQAFDLTVRFDAPPISNRWIDSQAALAAAHQEMGREREQYGSVPSTMLLMRGAFDEKEPDRTCWLVCFRAQALPSLYIVVDASTGSIVRNWRG